MNSKNSPQSKEAEMMVLGCMLTSINSLNIAADRLDDSDFYFPEHQKIFKILKQAYLQERPADVHLVCEELKRQGMLANVGGVSYVATLAQYAATSAYIDEYVDLVKNKSLLRKMVDAAQRVEKQALSEPDDVFSALDEAQQHFFAIGQSASSTIGVSLKDLLSGIKAHSKTPFLKELQLRQERYQTVGHEQGAIPGIPTHFIELDKLIGGLGNSNLMILAARPAMGKTALAINIAENICFKNRVPVGIFSLEMSAEQLLHRMICAQAEVESDKIKSGSLSGVEYQRIVAIAHEMQQQIMVIDDQPGLKITDLRARARRMKETYKIGFLVIDYLQLISGSGINRNMDRHLEISEISRMLKNLARELDIPILCCAQLSRKVEDRQGHRPMMSDLRESGCLAGDTLIADAHLGRRISIKELAERKEQHPFYVYGVDENERIGKYRLLKAFSSGEKQLFRLTTSSGRWIKATANHPFLTQKGWVPLEKLVQGEPIALPNSQELGEKDLVTCHLFWDPIASIVPLGKEEVFDATIEGVHNFLANGIFVHNSIEQDADLVLFLLRREYYDPLDKPGLAEVIVAKNRHGAVGSVQLTYRKQLAQFANYSGLNFQAGGASDAFKDFE